MVIIPSHWLKMINRRMRHEPPVADALEAPTAFEEVEDVGALKSDGHGARREPRLTLSVFAPAAFFEI
jgi:hypothetical protein